MRYRRPLSLVLLMFVQATPAISEQPPQYWPPQWSPQPHRPPYYPIDPRVHRGPPPGPYTSSVTDAGEEIPQQTGIEATSADSETTTPGGEKTAIPKDSVIDAPEEVVRSGRQKIADDSDARVGEDAGHVAGETSNQRDETTSANAAVAQHLTVEAIDEGPDSRPEPDVEASVAPSPVTADASPGEPVPPAAALELTLQSPPASGVHDSTAGVPQVEVVDDAADAQIHADTTESVALRATEDLVAPRQRLTEEAAPPPAAGPENRHQGNPSSPMAEPVIAEDGAADPDVEPEASRDISPATAVEPGEKGLESGVDVQQRHEYALQAMRAGDYAEAFCIWRPLAEAGDAQAQFSLGWMYHNGYGLAIDNDKTLAWWGKAAEQNLADASFALGMLFSQERGADRDLARGVAHYLDAAQSGHADAKLMLRSLLQREGRAVSAIVAEWDWQQWQLIGLPSRIKVDRANVRKGPSTETPVVTKLVMGDTLFELGREGRWVHVSIPDKVMSAWVFDSLVEPVANSLPQ